MRLSLLALLVLSSAAPSAQTLVPASSAPVAERFKLSDAFVNEFAADASLDGARGDVWAGVLVGVFAAPVAGTGGLAATFALIVVDCEFPFGCTDPAVGPAGYAAGWIIGSAAGAMYMATLLSASSSRRGSPFRSDDWKAALVGVSIGTLVGTGVTVAVSGYSEGVPFGGMIATTVLQAVGAGVAVGLRP